MKCHKIKIESESESITLIENDRQPKKYNVYTSIQCVPITSEDMCYV